MFLIDVVNEDAGPVMKNNFWHITSHFTLAYYIQDISDSFETGYHVS